VKQYLFAKFFKHLSAAELMEHCLEAGVDGPTALVRTGYWVEPESLARDLPPFVKAAEDAGLEVRFASTSFSPAGLIEDPTPMKVLADNGVRLFRVGYVSRAATGHVRGLGNHARRMAEGVAVAAEAAGIKAVIQLHGGQYPHSATAAYPVVKDLNPEHIAVMIDPGNNLCQEGYERWDYQIQLLGEYVAAMGTKDACARRTGDPAAPNKGWARRMVPAFEGEADWQRIFTELAGIGFSGPLILMPFYDTDDFPMLFANFKKEVAYLKETRRRVSRTARSD